ncbi:hypothetical protein RE9414_12830 [Prescottella equi]|nr:hypothetical protein RE9414_12830 [Prescottella equi]
MDVAAFSAKPMSFEMTSASATLPASWYQAVRSVVPVTASSSEPLSSRTLLAEYAASCPFSSSNGTPQPAGFDSVDRASHVKPPAGSSEELPSDPDALPREPPSEPVAAEDRAGETRIAVPAIATTVATRRSELLDIGRPFGCGNRLYSNEVGEPQPVSAAPQAAFGTIGGDVSYESRRRRLLGDVYSGRTVSVHTVNSRSSWT